MQVSWPRGQKTKLQVKRQGGRNAACVRTEQVYDESPGPVKHFTEEELEKLNMRGGSMSERLDNI